MFRKFWASKDLYTGVHVNHLRCDQCNLDWFAKLSEYPNDVVYVCLTCRHELRQETIIMSQHSASCLGIE